MLRPRAAGVAAPDAVLLRPWPACGVADHGVRDDVARDYLARMRGLTQDRLAGRRRFLDECRVFRRRRTRFGNSLATARAR
jgi:hypothetical protein